MNPAAFPISRHRYISATTSEEIRCGRKAAGSVKQVLESYTKSRVLVLSGATLDEVLYYVWKGQPVLSVMDVGRPVVITGYTAKDIVYYDPERGKSVTVAKDKAETMFAENGRIYISFLY